MNREHDLRHLKNEIRCRRGGSVEVIYTDEFGAWYTSLDRQAQEAVTLAVKKLEALGVALPFPTSSELRGTRYLFRELRAQAGGRPLHVVYAFDPARDAVLLIGGDKTGDKRFYERILSEATAIWKEYLNENF